MVVFNVSKAELRATDSAPNCESSDGALAFSLPVGCRGTLRGVAKVMARPRAEVKSEVSEAMNVGCASSTTSM